METYFITTFQYNDCLGSSYYRIDAVEYQKEFQYNDCLGSSDQIKNRIKNAFRFQYNDCLGSSRWILATVKALWVSIQRLFGFVNQFV